MAIERGEHGHPSRVPRDGGVAQLENEDGCPEHQCEGVEDDDRHTPNHHSVHDP